MKYDLIILDWDGTVMDSTDRIVACMHDAGAELGLPALADEAVREIIGLGLPEAIRTLYPDVGDARLADLREHFARHFVAAERTPNRLYPGVRETVATLHHNGARLAVATGKSRKGLERVWASSGLAEWFVSSRCADETRSKPEPDMIVELLAELDVSADRALMVGDTAFDLEMARAAGVDRIGVSYGAHPVARLRQCAPLAIIDALPQLLSLVGCPPVKQSYGVPQ